MKFFLAILFCLGVTASMISQNPAVQTSKEAKQLSVPVMDFDELEHYLKDLNSQVLVVNFWATWCAPCVEELHYFEYANRDFKDQNVKVILVSLDFKRSMDSRLIPFLEDRGIESDVILLSDPRSNTWIDRVAPEWSGAIPATWFISGENAIFNEGKYSSYDDLKKSISTFLKL